MKHFSALLLAAVAFAAAAVNAEAQTRWPKWYIDLHGGMAFSNDINGDETTLGGVGLELDNGYTVGGALGYNVAKNVRTEIELNYRDQDIDNVSAGGLTFAGTDNVEALSYMLNAYYDIPVSWRFKPYLGAGAGWATVSSDALGGDDDTVFAYQFMGGFGYAPKSIPMTEFTIGYRYFKTNEASFETSPATKFDLEYEAHNLEAGMKMKF